MSDFIVSPNKIDIVVATTGLKGDPGNGGGSGIRIPFGFGDASPKLLITASSQTIYQISLIITTAFNGAQSFLRIGTSAEPDLLMSASQNDPFVVGEYEVSPIANFTIATEIVLAIALGEGCSQGAGIVVIEV